MSFLNALEKHHNYYNGNTSIEYTSYGYKVFFHGNLIIDVDTQAKKIFLDTHNWSYKVIRKRMRDIVGLYLSGFKTEVVDDSVSFYVEGNYIGSDMVVIHYA